FLGGCPAEYLDALAGAWRSRRSGPVYVLPARRDSRVATLAQHTGRALRRLAVQPSLVGFTVLTLGFAIAATASVFSIVDAVLLRPGPFHDADRLFQILNQSRRGFTYAGLSPVKLRQWRSEDGIFDAVEAYRPVSALGTGGVEPEELHAAEMSPGLVAMLGIRPVAGGVFTAADAQTPNRPIPVGGGFLGLAVRRDPHRLALLGIALRRRPCRGGAHAARQRQTPRDCGCHAGSVPFPDARRTDLAPARSRRRRRRGGTPPQHDRAAAKESDDGCCPRASRRRGRPARAWAAAAERLGPDAGAWTGVRGRRRDPAHRSRHLRRGRAGAADRVRQRRQPAAVARHRAPARVRDPADARRERGTPLSRAADRRRLARPHIRRGRPGGRSLGSRDARHLVA